MDQSDVDLLQIVPSYHLQAVIKSRHISLSALNLNEGALLGTGILASYSPTVLQELAHALFNPASLHEVLANLDEVPALILRELVGCGGRANSRDLALYFTCAGLLEPGNKSTSTGPTEDPIANRKVPRITVKLPPQPPQQPHYPPPHPHGMFEQALRHLLMLGLVFWGKQTNFAGRDYTSGVHDGVLVVPASVSSVAREVWKLDGKPILPATSINENDESNITDLLSKPQTLQRALYLYWSLVVTQREGLSLLGNGLLSRSSLKLVVDSLQELKGLDGQGNEKRFVAYAEPAKSETDVPYLYFLRLLLIQLDLLQVQDTTLKAVSAVDFFALPLIERTRQCYQLYLSKPFWNELAFLPEVNVRPGPTPLEPAHSEVMQARRTLLGCLQLESAQTWKDITAFIAHVKLSAPYLLFPRQYGPRAERYSSGSNPYGWDFRLRRGWLTHREGWHMVEGGFIRAMVGGPLYWLGLVELDREEYPTQFRLSPAAFLLLKEHLEGLPTLEDVRGRLIVQPNFEVMVLAPVSEASLVMLDRFAERVSLDLVAHYRMNRASITRAIQHDLRVEPILRQLEQATGNEIPQNVRYTLAEWERQARRIEVWQNMTLLEVDDESLLDELLADEHYRTFFGRRLTPRLIEVVANQLAAIQALFWQRNTLPSLTAISPAVTEPEEETQSQKLLEREPQWQLHEDGLLQPLYPVLDFYQVVEVQRFCEVEQGTSWYKITATSIRQAIKQGFGIDTIIQFLQDSCAEGIPGSLLIRMKLWGGGYNGKDEVYVEHSPMIRLPEEICQDLFIDKELQQLLGTEVEPAYRLIRIDPEHLEQVLTLLRKRGFRVD